MKSRLQLLLLFVAAAAVAPTADGESVCVYVCLLGTMGLGDWADGPATSSDEISTGLPNINSAITYSTLT